jgi:hypothetical protein
MSVGTSTPQSGTRTLIISQTSDSSTYGLKVLSSNNSPLLLVRSDGKVSIATSGASYALNVSGDIYASGNLVVGGTFSAPIPAGNVTPGVFNSLQGGGTGAYAFLGSLGIATSSQVGLPQTLSVYGGGYFSGNVGIGKTTPTALLHIASSTSAIINLEKTGTNANVSYITNDGELRIVSGRNLYLQSAAGMAIFFRKGTTEVMRIPWDSNNVGIGTTSPAYKLDVVGQINSSGGLCIAGDCKTSWSQVGGSSQWTNTTGGIYYLGNVGIGTSAVSYPLFISTSTDTLFAIQRTGASSPTIFKQGTDSAFVINNGGSDILIIKSGNVGIGTTGPIAKLHTVGNVQIDRISDASTGRLFINGGGLGYSSLNISPTGDRAQIFLGNNVDANGNKFIRVSGGNLEVVNNAYSAVLFAITDSGNVGIGTTSPSQKLHISGTGDTRMRISGSGTGQNTWVGIELQTASEGIFRNLNDARLVLWNSGERLTVTAAGNVGIGTTAPKGKFAVSFNNDDEIVMYSSGDNHLAIQTTLDGQPLGTYGGGENRLALQPLVGVVGIGTLDPVYKLDVASNGSYTARFGTASTDTVVIGGGAGKLTVGTIDPVYSIGGKKYATYGPESIGVKVGHTGVLKLVLNKNRYEGVLDFKNAKEGDDLWLFAKTTNLASNFDKLTIQLTPAFKGKVWYNKDKENMIVKIYGEADELNNNELEVSYSLSAPRFDFEKWPNYSNDETVEGIKIY